MSNAVPFSPGKINKTLSKGEGRLKIIIRSTQMGEGLVVTVYNQNAHIGAMALGDYDRKTRRVSVSVITRLGHKDDTIAQRAAYLISKSTHQPSCVIAGIHLDNITKAEISKIASNAEDLVKQFIDLNVT